MAQQAAKADPDVEKWINCIAIYEREFKKWENRVEKIIKRYKDENRNQTSTTSQARFNILWANVQTAIPAVFSRIPQPDVSRRHRDVDPVGRVASLILERGLEFEINHYPDYRAAMRNSVQDRVLGGRGVAWVRYEPHFRAMDRPDGFQVTEDADTEEGVEQTEEIDYECAPTDYVHWKDFGHVVARTWEEVTAVWRRVYMNRAALVERFGDKGAKIPLDTKPRESKSDWGEVQAEACIYEIWDKASGRAIWLSRSMKSILDELDDPLGLENFWPCPRPLFATLTTDSLVPVPDFALYQDQASTLDMLEDRIEGLIQMLQVKGVYDASTPELARLFTEGQNGNLLAVKNWAAFAEKSGLRGAIDVYDITPVVGALKAAYEAVEEQKRQIYEITGLADIIRASTDPRETATAQKLKGSFGSMRLRNMQQDVAQFATELLQIKAQIMCKHFDPQSLATIGAVETLSDADKQLIPQALQLLKNSTLRDFRIEVASDSLVQIDEQQEKEDANEFLTAVGGFIDKVSQVSPDMAPLVGELLKFGVTRYKIGKTVEGAIDQALEALKQKAAQPQQPQPNPKLQEIQAKSQADMQAAQQKAQIEAQTTRVKAQAEMQIAQAEQQAQAQQEAQRQQSEAQLKQMEAMLERQTAMFQAQLDAKLKQLEAQMRPPPARMQ